MTKEVEDYEHDGLYPLAVEQVEINPDARVRVNYDKFDAALNGFRG